MGALALKGGVKSYSSTKATATPVEMAIKERGTDPKRDKQKRVKERRGWKMENSL